MDKDTVEIIGAYGSKSSVNGLTSIRVSKEVMIDAGNILNILGDSASDIHHIFLTHSHLDHIVDIPFLIDVFFEKRDVPLNIYATKETICNLQKYIFNWEIWPDFANINLLDSKQSSIKFHILEYDKKITIDSVTLKPIRNNHVSGSCGFVVTKHGNSILFSSDTYKSKYLIDELNSNKNIKIAVFDVSFPNRLSKLAKDSKHMTLDMLNDMLDSVNKKDIKICIYHLKATFIDEIKQDIKNCKKDISILDDGDIINIKTCSLIKNKPTELKLKNIIHKLTHIGYALGTEKNFDKLMEDILVTAKEFTNADGGTIYMMSENEKELEFKVVQTDSLNIKMGGISGGKITWPNLPLYIDGTENRTNVSAVCALDGELINVENVYETKKFNFDGTKKFDKSTGYKSVSMLVIPMKNHENEVIGVLQLINKKSVDGNFIQFDYEDENLIQSLASQAAVSITNNNLIKDLENLLMEFIKTIADAINEKSKYTGGHINRVAELSTMLATEINKRGFKNIYFNNDELHQIDIAAWMHDIGKITTPEYVVDKATKLETIFDRIEHVKLKCEILRKDYEIDYLKNIITKDEFTKKSNQVDEIINFLEKINKGSEFMPDSDIEKLNSIKNLKININDKKQNLLSDDEVYNLSIRKGTLTNEERNIINYHVTMSYNMLKNLTFPKKLKDVPKIAGSHHKKIRTDKNGTHLGYGAKEIMSLPMSIEDKILAIADVFEAVTASDRPYKEPNTLNQSIKILTLMAKDGDLDYDLVKFFIDNKLYEDYAKDNLNKSQLDEVTVTLQ